MANGVLEDVCAYIGYTATCRLTNWFAGRPIYIPTEVSEGHLIARVLDNMLAFKRLVEFADDHLIGVGRVLMLPSDYEREIIRRNRWIAVMLTTGADARDVARVAMITEAQMRNIRRRLEADGLLPLIRACADQEAAGDE